MAYNQTIEIPAHPNIYTGNNERSLQIKYSIPQKGTNVETGIVLFVPGFGGNINSNVYKKMREVFADQYNLITVQCDFFGSKYMQEAEGFKCNEEELSKLSKEHLEELMLYPEKLESIIKNYSIQFKCSALMDETENDFADMGYMQAIDLITAVEAVKIILNENHLLYDKNKIIGYGHSQGAFLLHLANKLAPHLFTYIFDNSSWVQPVYLTSNRGYLKGVGQAVLIIEFEYFAKKYLVDKSALSLHNLYKAFKNGSYIFSLLGTTDNLVVVEDKKKSLSNINYVRFKIIDDKKIDGEIFKSTNHGLDADFLKLFDYLIREVPSHRNKIKFKSNYLVASSQTVISVNYSNGLPLFQFQ